MHNYNSAYIARLAHGKRRRSDADELEYTMPEEPLRLDNVKRLRSSVFGHWKSQPHELTLPQQHAPTPPSTTAELWQQQQHQAQYLHQMAMAQRSVNDHSYHHMTGANNLNELPYCEPPMNCPQQLAQGNVGVGPTILATPTISPDSFGCCDSDGDDEMEDTGIDPSSEYYHINTLLNQLHRERTLRRNYQ
ncbi:hypothetical protein BX661DRAFT_222610 [Kickxella alabastrina]|uniref:uncharacterized protein n=1 Tax=Kickxella alabastrina TaxID=61397 RepID=UPI00221F6864|nr:uncharacterized protein BX661DRAFT_222610 [Kickxella alabastrina]KAI7833799.1 hypothetical protein BX661DRAFT_222610 [Kickxella alabastrina]